jgi:hypothetical protein
MKSLSKNNLGRRSSRLVSSPLVAVTRVPASPEQRLKVAGQSCAVCARSPVDPAHLVPQRLGGCSDPDCVIGLCRTHHRLFDTRRLALAPYLGRRFRRERAHALNHVSAAELADALAGGGWPPPWSQTNKEE